MAFDEFLRKRIFEPLGMLDTHFILPEEKVSRLATAYAYTDDKGLYRVPDEPQSIPIFGEDFSSRLLS
jgi:CubicO group peptidase (beta-lactamase class C family)